MDRHAPGGDGTRRQTVPAVLIAVFVYLWIAQISGDGQTPAPPPQPGAAQAFTAHAGDTLSRTSESSPVAAMPPSAPTRVRVPAIRVDAPLTGLALERDGRLASPPEADRNLVGWYEDGTTPGATGTAVVGGHVDVPQGRAVFYDLGSLKKGNSVEVDRADGRTAVFTIDAIEVYTSDDFPDEKVYGPAPRPELRLITCGGGFDKASRKYLGNVVVYAHLTAGTA